jgi:hypothetical protein
MCCGAATARAAAGLVCSARRRQRGRPHLHFASTQESRRITTVPGELPPARHNESRPTREAPNHRGGGDGGDGQQAGRGPQTAGLALVNCIMLHQSAGLRLSARSSIGDNSNSNNNGTKARRRSRRRQYDDWIAAAKVVCFSLRAARWSAALPMGGGRQSTRLRTVM